MAIILTADIGGTNCRLARFSLDDGKLALERSAWIQTEDVAHTEALLLAFEREMEIAPHNVEAVVVAIAGPVQGCLKGSLTNARLRLDFTPLNEHGMRFFLLNDFMAQAYAVLSPEGEGARRIAGPVKPLEDSIRAVIGAGTGLGQATVIRLATPGKGHGASWLAVPSEFGHMPFPFIGAEEQKLQEFMRKELQAPYVVGDEALTGRGLGMLHHFLTGEKLMPAEVGEAALCRDTDTLRWYARFYGRACRSWMLATLCRGGLWIAGGIAAKNPLTVTCEAFMTELYGSSRWEELLRSIPVYLMEDTNSGLWGAARFGQQQVEPGM